MSIQVINRHHFHDKPMPDPNIYVGRGTPLGNTVSRREDGKYIIGVDTVASPERAMGAYGDWLWRKIEARDPEVMAALNSIGPNHFLVCSCAPAPCHADVVARAAEWLHGKGEW